MRFRGFFSGGQKSIVPLQVQLTLSHTVHTPIIITMNKCLALFATATTLAGASHLRSNQHLRSYPCDTKVAECITSCLKMSLPFPNEHCNDEGLLSCTNGSCTMSKIMSAKLMDEAKNSDGTTQAPAVEAEAEEEDVSLSAVETKQESSDTTTETSDTTTEASDTTTEALDTMAVPETTTADQVVAQLPGTKEKYEARLKQLEQMIAEKSALGESPSEAENEAVLNLKKLLNIQNLESFEKREIQETKDLLQKEEATEQKEESQADSMTKQMLLGGSQLLTGLETI
jgi:hypothetical protein